jgi:hypothetical protein
VYGPVTEQGDWRIRTKNRGNDKRPLIWATDLKRIRLEWLGVDYARAMKNIFGSNPQGRRKLGRLRLRCLEDMQSDSLELKLKRWRQRKIIEKSKILY